MGKKRPRDEMKADGWVRQRKSNYWLGGLASKMGLAPYGKWDDVTNKDELVEVASTTCTTKDSFWRNCTVGHWLIGPLGKEGGRHTYACFSKCGVVAFYEAWEIANGKLSQTCHGCNPQAGVPNGSRVLSEPYVKQLQQFWQEDDIVTAFDETSHLVGKDGKKAWDELGRPFLADICARCGYGRTFGWKVIVLKANTRSDAVSDNHSAKVRAIHKIAKKIEISMQPAKCNYRFEVELCTQRCDHDFWEVAQKVKSMIEHVCPEAAEPTKVTGLAAAATGTSNGDGHDSSVKVIDLAQLAKLGGTIEKALQIGKDINEMATLKLAANQKLTNAKDHEETKRREYEAAKAAYDEKQKLYVAKKELVDDLDRRLKAAVKERDETQAVTNDLLAKLETKRLELKPWSDTVATAEKELADLAAIEAEQAKQIGSVDGLRALIAALSNLPG